MNDQIEVPQVVLVQLILNEIWHPGVTANGSRAPYSSTDSDGKHFFVFFFFSFEITKWLIINSDVTSPRGHRHRLLTVTFEVVFFPIFTRTVPKIVREPLDQSILLSLYSDPRKLTPLNVYACPRNYSSFTVRNYRWTTAMRFVTFQSFGIYLILTRVCIHTVLKNQNRNTLDSVLLNIKK